ncbi:hypothetical protein EH196_07000 [Bacillus sp. C1-1]|nr:hypothetical protein EH196_07000 [Bacillus sp. C1-1]
MSDLSLNDLKLILGNTKNALISGNGLSMNFDNSFCNIYSDLFKSHKKVIYETKYDVNANKEFKTKLTKNYKSVLQHLRLIDEEYLNKLFQDGVEFSNSIYENEELYKELKKNDYFNELSFGLTQWDILKQICDTGVEYGFRYVNVEHWSILIYFYAAIKRLNLRTYRIPSNNTFIRAIERGDIHKSKLLGNDKNNYMVEFVLLNGFFTYYRMLFSTRIFSDGKAIDIDKQDKKDGISLNSIRNFLNSFDELFTLNFDHIVEQLTKRDVVHIHGEFVINQKEYVYSQSYNLIYNGKSISFSDILIGDYFMAKVYLPEISRLSAIRNPNNKKLISPYDKFKNGLNRSEVETVIIFGMSIENDYHIIRYLMLIFHELKVEKPHIVYSYFNEKEKKEFEERYFMLITFSNEVSQYAKNIKVSFIKTQEILKEYF